MCEERTHAAHSFILNTYWTMIRAIFVTYLTEGYVLFLSNTDCHWTRAVDMQCRERATFYAECVRIAVPRPAGLNTHNTSHQNCTVQWTSQACVAQDLAIGLNAWQAKRVHPTGLCEKQVSSAVLAVWVKDIGGPGFLLQVQCPDQRRTVWQFSLIRGWTALSCVTKSDESACEDLSNQSGIYHDQQVVTACSLCVTKELHKLIASMQEPKTWWLSLWLDRSSWVIGQ